VGNATGNVPTSPISLVVSFVLLASFGHLRLVIRTPQVRDFGAALVWLNLAKQLQSVNVLAPTDMCRVMTRCGSDKGRSNNYMPLYSALFKERYDQPQRIFELGLGSNNLDV